MSADDPDRPPTEEELADSARLRDALDEDPIASALKAAWAPEPIDAAVHDQIVDDVPTEEELKLAAIVDEDEMMHALKAAWNPTEISAADHQRIVDRATAGMVIRVSPKRRVGVVVTSVMTAFALAAGFVFFVQSKNANAPGASGGEVALAHVRSTQPLFGEPFKEGETSARIDRIAMARASDYRDNYFAKRGVR